MRVSDRRKVCYARTAVARCMHMHMQHRLHLAKGFYNSLEFVFFSYCKNPSKREGLLPLVISSYTTKFYYIFGVILI